MSDANDTMSETQGETQGVMAGVSFWIGAVIISIAIGYMFSEEHGWIAVGCGFLVYAVLKARCA